MELTEFRKEIDQIDQDIVELFKRRMAVCREVADFKKQNGIPVLDSRREAEKLDAVGELAGEEMDSYVRSLYIKIMELAKSYERHQQGKDSADKSDDGKDHFALLGRKLGHSYSPLIHSKFGSYVYDLVEVEPEDFEEMVRSSRYRGFNVTIPYKIKAYEICDELGPDAVKVGCVNTLIKTSEGKIKGYNTDLFGFRFLLERNNIHVGGKKCIILGSGGSSLTVKTVLQELGAKSITIISRSGENNYGNLDRHYDSEIIVNTTPVGMYPDNGASLIDLSKFENCTGVVDLIYNPNKTTLILEAMKRGIPCAGGTSMLVAQAKAASEKFQNKMIDDEDIAVAIDELRKETLNTVLIGMPGAGKTYLGEKMAESQHKEFFDIDEIIAEREGMSIEEIFRLHGEDYFRDLETKTLREICMKSGKIIASGGGAVTMERNYDIIKQNSIVIWIKRDVDKLDVEGRPLSKINKLQDMFEARKARYQGWSDYYIDNNQDFN